MLRTGSYLLALVTLVALSGGSSQLHGLAASHRMIQQLTDGGGPAPPPVPLAKPQAGVVIADGGGPAPPPVPLARPQFRA